MDGSGSGGEAESDGIEAVVVGVGTPERKPQRTLVVLAQSQAEDRRFDIFALHALRRHLATKGGGGERVVTGKGVVKGGKGR